ncbi:hypothetical protein ACOMHN_029383 [Nucella lapillus]
MDPAQSQWTGSQSTSGAQVAQYFGGGGGGGGGSMSENNDVSSSSLFPGSQPLGDDVLRKISTSVNEPFVPSGSTGTGNPMTSTSGSSSSAFGVSDMSALAGGYPPYMGVVDSYGVNGAGMPPYGPSAGLMPGFPYPLSTPGFMRMGRRLGKTLGVKEYYDIHGCEDPALLFSGRQRTTATFAMTQPCQSLQAAEVCRMVQTRERTSNSLLASSLLPLHMKTRLENCLSAKALLNTLSLSSFIPSSPFSPYYSPSFLSPSLQSGMGSPSLRECGVLLSSVMDGGSLDPESMKATRRQLLPWVCNESTLGPSGLPFRVCCPGRVPEPTLQEAQIVRRMVNA